MAEQTTRSGKAVGTRDHVVAWLAAHGDLHDPSGMASRALARSIGYPGSSIAFAQLLSGMERSGLILREVRGKRTYRVALTEAGRERLRSGGRTVSHRRTGAGGGRQGDAGVDYDELARRLLLQVASRLVGEGAPDSGAETTDGRGTEQRAKAADRTATEGTRSQPDSLEQRLRALEVELTQARAARVTLEHENEALRAQLDRIRSNLEGETRRDVRHGIARQPVQDDDIEVALLKQMLLEREGGNRREHDKVGSA